MGALQWVDIPEYSAVIFRRTLRQHQLPGALLNRAKKWLNKWSNEVKFNGDTYTFTFPSGAEIVFGYMDSKDDRENYLSTEFQYIAFDELTTFEREEDWDELNGRLRKRKDMPMPLRIRGASNPGGPGHEWVKRRFIDPGTPGVPFIPATVEDNPFIDKEYAGALESIVDPVRREQLRRGDWDVLPEGKTLLREWFKFIKAPIHEKNKVRIWDMAATDAEKKKANRRDPDYTAGGLMCFHDGIFTIEDVRRGQWSPARVEEEVKKAAEQDGVNIPIWFEVEPGASSLILVDQFRRNILGGRYMVHGKHATGDKNTRLRPWAAAAQKGLVQLVEAPWNLDFLREATALGTSDQIHDDMMDMASLGYQVLTVEGPNFEDWANYYKGEIAGTRQKVIRPEQMNEQQYAEWLMQKEREASAKILERRAKKLDQF